MKVDNDFLPCSEMRLSQKNFNRRVREEIAKFRKENALQNQPFAFSPRALSELCGFLFLTQLQNPG